MNTALRVDPVVWYNILVNLERCHNGLPWIVGQPVKVYVN